MARSRLINVPRKPDTMSGPCASGSAGWTVGSAHPRRTSPAHIPASNAKSPTSTGSEAGLA